MRIRLLAVDLDGTLVNDRLEMDPRDVAAVKAATAAGVTVVLATGRMFKSSLRYAEPLGLTGPIINYQGAVVREIASGEVWYRCELTVPMQQRVLAFAEPRDWHVNAYVDEQVYTARARPEADLRVRLGVAGMVIRGSKEPLIRAVGLNQERRVVGVVSGRSIHRTDPHRLIASVHPAVAATMTHVDDETEPRLERILSEMRTQAKLDALQS